ncbi:M16 family metallopeptidase [Christiangramia sabulilitoris]|uniref:Insulinase family protein n=1 Tax=Christiangramia sabulilitoris TaxID=2583991 RepID=A0A550I7C1_9FLAO|nr:insulinase family protein [Christiangramia sabulilitoris]TRO66866.1 insulinase family protein [Christiangramia sabulilitoris]
MKNYLNRNLWVLFLVATSISFAQSTTEEKIPTDPNVKIGKLENGLTYYIRNNGKPEDKLELRLAIKAGSILETDEQQGLAHFIEHMNFNGTKNFEKNELIDYLQSIGVKFGADLNAYTSFDETVYILPIPSDDPEKLEGGFTVLEDWAHNALLTEEAIDGERGVVMEEYRLGLGPDKRMMQEYLPKLMHNSRYAERLPIGKKEVIEGADYETIRSYYKDWYRPGLMAVIAVGDLDVDIIEQKIKSHFSNLEKRKNPTERKEYGVPNHEETFVAIAKDPDANFSRVQIYYKDLEEAKDVVTIADYRKNLERSMFSSMINNRLQELANSTTPPFTYGFSYYGGTFSPLKNAYQSFAMTGENDQLTALKALVTENERVKRYGFNENEFARAKKEYLARLEKQFKDRDKQASNRIVGQYVSNFLQNSPIPGIEWTYQYAKENLDDISLENINGLINDFIHDENRVVVLTGPEKESIEKITEEQVLAILKDVENSEIEEYAYEDVRENLITDMPAAGSVKEVKTNEDLNVKTLLLSNGAKVVYKKTDFKNDEILFSAYSAGGTSLYSNEEFLSTVYANGGLTEAGIGGLDKNELNKMMSGKIVNVRPGISSYSEGFSGSTTPKDFEIMMQMIHLYFTDLNKDEEAYESFATKQKNFLGNLMSNPNFYFQNEIGKFRNEGNPRYAGFPTPQKFDEMDYDLAYQKYQERFADASDFTFYFVGNLDEEKVKKLSAKYIASLPSKNSKEEFRAPEFREKTDSYREKTVYKGKDPKSLVSIMWNGETEYDEEDDLAFSALGEILTIKLVEELREEEGGVYGVGARGNMSKIPYDSYSFSISFPCGPENVEKLTKSAIAEVQKIKKDGPSQEDLDKVKETFRLQRKEKLKENKFWIAQLEKAERENMDISEIEDYNDMVEELETDDIQKMAEKYLNENYLLGVLMPETEDSAN